MPTDTILLIRHAEKPQAPGGGLAIDDEGHEDPHGLSVRGWQRAGTLVRLFAPLQTTPRPTLARPAALWAARTTDEHPSRRPLFTLQPLALELGRQIRQDFGDADDPAAIAAAMQQEDGPLLASWRHDSLPSLAHALAPQAEVPAAWPGARYDLVWVFERRQGRWSFRQVPQQLLPGDSPEPIAPG